MATNTAASFTNHTGNGNTDSNGKSDAFNISFAYLAESEIDVTVGDDPTPKTQGTHYEFASGTTIKFLSGHVPTNGTAIKFQRDTDISAKKIDFQDGSVLTEADLDTQSDQILFAQQEINDIVTNDLFTRDGLRTITGSLTFEGSSDDANETTLAVTNPTADRTITFPNADGNVVLDTLAQTLTNKTITATAFTSSNVDINGGAIDGTPIGANSASTGAFTTGTIATANTTNLTNTQKLKVNSGSASDDGDGTYTLSGGFITIGDNDANALQLFHDTNNSNSFISEVGTGDLVIVTNGTNLFLQKDTTSGHAEDFIQCIANGAVTIFHDSQPKLTTLATGIEVTGNVDLDGITGAGVVTSGTSSSDTQVYSAKRAEERFFGKNTLGEIQSGETWTSDDQKIATTAAIDARIIDLVDDVGGFVPIANETSFPNTNPDINNGAGTLISIAALSQNLTSNGAGEVVIANGTVGNSTVFLVGAPANTTFTAGFGLIVETKDNTGGVANTYTFHRYVPNATSVTTVATNITNVNTTATNIGNVNNVGGNIANVNSVANNASNINSAVSNASNINSVANNASIITTVAGSISNVNIVAGISSAVANVATDASDIGTVAGKATEIGLLGTASAVADMALLGTSDVIADMNLLANTEVINDMALLGTTDVVNDMHLLGNAGVVANMNLLGNSSVITDMGLLGTTDVVTDMALLATTDVIADMALLATTDVIADMNLLGNSAVITDMNLLGNSDVIADMALLATSDVVADMALLATSDVITDMALLGTTDVVADMAILATSDVIADMNTLATTANITAMDNCSDDITNINTVAGSIANVNTVSTNITNVTNASNYLNNFLQLYLGEASSNPTADGLGNAITEGDLYFNTVDKRVRVFNGSVFQNLAEGAIEVAKFAIAAFNSLYTASAGSNSIDLGGLAITGAAFSNEAVAANRVSLAKGSGTFNLGGI